MLQSSTFQFRAQGVDGLSIVVFIIRIGFLSRVCKGYCKGHYKDLV